MRPSKLHQLYGFVFAILCLSVIPLQAHAKTSKGKTEKAAPQVEKEKVILLPLVISAEAQNMSSEMQAAVVQGLQQKYLVYSGDRVLQELKKASEKQNHSAKHECDETRCLQDIATAFQTENVAVVHINKIEGGYLLSVSIKGVISNEAVFDNSLPCKGCDAFQVVDKLKELSGTVAPVAVTTFLATPQAKVNQNAPDAVLWAEAQKGNTVEDYQVYLDTYPKGKSAPFAKARIKKLNEATQAELEQQEQHAWDTAQKEASEDSFGIYLKGYPAGRFAGLAKVRLNKIKNDVEAKEETSVWNKADSSNDQAAIEGYLNHYPSGRYVAAASAKLTAIKEEAAKGPAMVSIPGKNYEMGKYDVTQKEWRDIMGTNPSHFTSCGDTCPVEQVSWNDVQEFIKKFNSKTGRQYRLPTEEEWLYACYGGRQTRYCGSNNIDSVAWYGNNGAPGGNSNQTTHPVGQKQANGYGLYDMSGNVYQYLQDFYDTANKEYHKIKGGAWPYDPFMEEATGGYLSSSGNDHTGFRLVRTLPSVTTQSLPDQKVELPKGFIVQGGLTWMPVTFTKPWEEANTYCTNTEINGQTDWRLPSSTELINLEASGVMNNQGWSFGNVWTHEKSLDGQHIVYSLKDSGMSRSDDTSPRFVACVR